jgi:hypothetical protein
MRCVYVIIDQGQYLTKSKSKNQDASRRFWHRSETSKTSPAFRSQSRTEGTNYIVTSQLHSVERSIVIPAHPTPHTHHPSGLYMGRSSSLILHEPCTSFAIICDLWIFACLFKIPTGDTAIRPDSSTAATPAFFRRTTSTNPCFSDSLSPALLLFLQLYQECRQT